MGIHSLNEVNAHLDAQLPGARVTCQTLPETDIQLYLIDPEFDDRQIATHVREVISDDPPYWIFCWASGRALATLIAQGKINVQGKRVLDFGSGSGVVAIAAAKAGAASVTTCDIDLVANRLVQLHAELNQVELVIKNSLAECEKSFDLVFAADVLYEVRNLEWLDTLRDYGEVVVIADSRQKNLKHPAYQRMMQQITTSYPDFAEAKTYNEVNIYRAEREQRE